MKPHLGVWLGVGLVMGFLVAFVVDQQSRKRESVNQGSTPAILVAAIRDRGRTPAPDFLTGSLKHEDADCTTLVLLETSQARGSWTAGGPSTVRGLNPEEPPYLGIEREFGGNHPGGANAVFADASVRFLRESLAPTALETMATIQGGKEAERVGDDP